MSKIDQEITIAITVTTLIILLLLSIITISIFISTRQRIKQKMVLAETLLNYEKELRQVENEVSEHMMEQFAQELHDNIGHILTCMRLTIENKKVDNPELTPVFQSVESYLDETSQHVRSLSRSLNTDYVNNLGVKRAIQMEVERIQQLRRHKIHLVITDGSASVDGNQELMAFRIFQEMIHNSIKHAKAKNIYIDLSLEDNFKLIVTDDGVGFDVDRTLSSAKASGLRNMIKRARMAGMDCHIESRSEGGCKYHLTKPINSVINRV